MLRTTDGPGPSHGALERAQGTANVAKECFTADRRADSVAAPLKKRDADAVFEVANPPAQRRLMNAERFGGAPEATMISDGNGIPQMLQPEIHYLNNQQPLPKAQPYTHKLYEGTTILHGLVT